MHTGLQDHVLYMMYGFAAAQLHGQDGGDGGWAIAGVSFMLHRMVYRLVYRPLGPGRCSTKCHITDMIYR